MKNFFRKVVVIQKKEGETPLEALSNFRAKHKKYQDVKMTYAGRLDPMASGLLLIIIGDEIKNKEKYLSLDKEYEFEILFGFATDTYDILGKVEHSNILTNIRMNKKELEEQIEENLKHFTGTFMQKYPMYSSKTLFGKQLFEYAREGIEVEPPEREVSVKKINFLGLRKVSNIKLLGNIEKRIKKVKGDFRQEEILHLWRENLKGESKEFFIGSFKIKCGGGTYVRSIANGLGEMIGIPSLAFSIKRTKVGKFAKMS